jgi:hypothetical protein
MNTSNDKIDSVLEKPLKMDKGGSKTLMTPDGKKVKATTRSAANLRSHGQDMHIARPRPSGRNFLTPLGDLGDILSNVGFHNAVKKISTNEKVFRRALADPKGYFEREGVSIPSGIVVKMKEKSTTKSGFQVSMGGWITIQVIQVCKDFGPITVCGAATAKITFGDEEGK